MVASSKVLPLLSQIFSARVIKVLDQGIQVKLPDERDGYIKRREISWERRISEPVKMPEVGDYINAVIFPENQGDGFTTISMSMRRVDNPWAKAIEQHRYKKEKFVEGEIVNVLYDRAYAQIEPGIDAVIYPNNVPKLREQSIADVLGLGDRISGLITAIKPYHLIEISLVKRLQKMDPLYNSQRELLEEYFGARQHPRIIDPTEPTVLAEQPAKRSTWLSQGIGRLVRILIVDNEENWLDYLKGGLMEAFNTEIDAVMTGEEALDKIQQHKEYSLILVDLQLHNEWGIDVAHNIHRKLPGAAILITSAAPFEDADRYPEFSYCPKNLDDLIDKINLMQAGLIQESLQLRPLAESWLV